MVAGLACAVAAQVYGRSTAGTSGVSGRSIGGHQLARQIAAGLIPAAGDAAVPAACSVGIRPLAGSGGTVSGWLRLRGGGGRRAGVMSG